MRKYIAPEGKVYDWKIPHTGKIIDLDGSEIPTEEHLYAKYLTLGQYDSIDEYKLVDEPEKGQEVEIKYGDKTENSSVQ